MLGLLRTKRRRADRDAVLRHLDSARGELGAGCGILLACQRSGAHAGCTGWLDDLERALARLELVHRSIEDSQGWPDETPQ